MKTIPFSGQECAILENDLVQLLVPRTIGPRILSLRFCSGANLFAELPDVTTDRPDGKPYHFYGGHRLWLSPEDPIRSYALDDGSVELSPVDGGLLVSKPVEAESGFAKSILVRLEANQPRLTLTHRLTNLGPAPVEVAPWAITQFRAGGVALLPQAQTGTGLLPNRSLALWPYTDISTSCLGLGNAFILLRAEMHAPFKLGFPNPRGWLAYWLDGVLFVKRASFQPQGSYPDFGCSSECYCNPRFLELETLGPLSRVEPGASVSHVETWELYADIPFPENEPAAQALANQLGLE